MSKVETGLSTVTITITTLILLALAGLIWLIFADLNANQTISPTASPTPSPTPAETPTPTPSPTPTPELSTYTDDIIGFSFQYPDAWTISEDTRQVGAPFVSIRIEPSHREDISNQQNHVRVVAAPAVGHGMEGYTQTSQEQQQSAALNWEVTHWDSTTGPGGAITAVHISSETDYAIEAYFTGDHQTLIENTYTTIFNSFSAQ